MRALAFAILASLSCASACRAGGSPRLEGRWKGTSVEGVAPEAMVPAMEFAREMELDFKGDTLTVKTGQDKQSGRFAIDGEDKGTVVLHTDRDGPADKQTFAFVNESTMRWTVFDGKQPVIIFQKLP